MHIGIVGLGYVGAVSAACLAEMGHQVDGFEHDEVKLARFRTGVSPFYEPGLDELLKRKGVMPYAIDKANADKLWALSENLID